MGLAEGVAAGDQRHGLLVIHRHAGEGLANVARRQHRVRIAIGSLGIDVDQAHLDGGQGLFELAFARVAAVAQPGALRAPIELFGLPDVSTATGETEGLEAHGFERDIAGQDHQVGPGNGVAIFLLDRPDQASRLVQIGIVRPGIERGETLLAHAGATAAIGDAIGAGAVPRHADEQAAIMPEIGWPPVLAVGHQGAQVCLDGIQVQLLEFFGIVEIRAHRVGQRGICVQHLHIQRLGPPVAILPAAPCTTVREWALAGFGFGIGIGHGGGLLNRYGRVIGG